VIWWGRCGGGGPREEEEEEEEEEGGEGDSGRHRRTLRLEGVMDRRGAGQW
jgi:hypothetical protein